MSEPVHFDLDEIEAQMRAGFASAFADVIKIPDADRAAVDAQMRAVDVHVAFTRWMVGEINRGAERNVLAAFVGTVLAGLLRTAVNNVGDDRNTLLINFMAAYREELCGIYMSDVNHGTRGGHA